MKRRDIIVAALACAVTLFISFLLNSARAPENSAAPAVGNDTSNWADASIDRIHEEPDRPIAQQDKVEAPEQVGRPFDPPVRVDPPPSPVELWQRQNRFAVVSSEKIGDVTVYLGSRFSRIYIAANAADALADQPMAYGACFEAAYARDGESLEEPTAGFIPIGGEAEELHYESSDQDILKLYQDGSSRFKSPGRVSASLEVGGKALSVTIEVIQLPLKSGVTSQNATNVRDVVEKLGLPSTKEKHRVFWPESETIDGIFYSAPPGGGIVAEHWRWDKLPGAVVSIVGNQVSGWVWSVSTEQSKPDR